MTSRPTAALTLLAALCAATAHAEPQALRRTTFVRIAPGPRSHVLDEVPANTQVDVAGCEESWCRVRYGHSVGWVAQEALGPVPSAAPAPSAVSCVDFAHTGWPRKGDAERLCLSSPR